MGDITDSQGRQETKLTQQQVKHTTRQEEKVDTPDDGELVRTEKEKTHRIKRIEVKSGKLLSGY